MDLRIFVASEKCSQTQVGECQGRVDLKPSSRLKDVNNYEVRPVVVAILETVIVLGGIGRRSQRFCTSLSEDALKEVKIKCEKGSGRAGGTILIAGAGGGRERRSRDEVTGCRWRGSWIILREEVLSAKRSSQAVLEERRLPGVLPETERRC